LSTIELRESWKAVLPEVSRIAREASALKGVAARLSAEDGYDALKRVQKDLARVEELRLDAGEVLARARKSLLPVRQWLDEEWTRRAADFAEDLHRWFLEREVTLSGHVPDMVAGALTIRIDVRRDQAALLYADEVVTDRVPLSPDRVFKAWRAACDRLERDSTPPRDLLADLQKAYREVLAVERLGEGRRVRLPDVHFRLFVQRQTPQVRQDPRKNRLKEYPRYQFAYDLGRLVRDGALRMPDGTEARFHPAQKGAAGSRMTSVLLDDGRGGLTPYSDVQFSAGGEA
jgi:hypothetical protein